MCSRTGTINNVQIANPAREYEYIQTEIFNSFIC